MTRRNTTSGTSQGRISSGAGSEVRRDPRTGLLGGRPTTNSGRFGDLKRGDGGSFKLIPREN